MNVQSFEIRLESVIDAKDACLSILRNSVTNSTVVENSLSLRRERQAELVQVYETLVSLAENFVKTLKLEFLCSVLSNFREINFVLKAVN